MTTGKPAVICSDSDVEPVDGISILIPWHRSISYTVNSIKHKLLASLHQTLERAFESLHHSWWNPFSKSSKNLFVREVLLVVITSLTVRLIVLRPQLTHPLHRQAMALPVVLNQLQQVWLEPKLRHQISRMTINQSLRSPSRKFQHPWHQSQLLPRNLYKSKLRILSMISLSFMWHIFSRNPPIFTASSSKSWESVKNTM